MSKTMCPGQDTAFWTPNDIYEVECAQCGNEMEFFKDDASRRCKKCGSRVQNPKLNLGCAQWCEHAAECLGYDPKATMGEDAQESLVDQVVQAMRKHFGKDERRITHALAVLDYAEQIMRREGANPKVVLTAAVLHDVGITEGERLHGSSAGRWQEKYGPDIADAIMKNLGMDEETRDHVRRIIANHHSARDIDTTEFRVIWDADWMVNIPDEYPDKTPEQFTALINKVFKTPSGKAMALAKYGQVEAK